MSDVDKDGSRRQAVLRGAVGLLGLPGVDLARTGDPAAGEQVDDPYRRGTVTAYEAMGEQVERLVLEPVEDHLAEVEERLAVIKRLMRKHGATLDEVISRHQDLTGELDDLANADLHAWATARGVPMGGELRQDEAPAFMVLVNEILHNVKQYMGGIPVNEDSLAIDVIERVGPGGHYLQDQHTLDNFRNIEVSC